MSLSGPQCWENAVNADELVQRAVDVLNPMMVGERLFGDVGAALQTDQGSVFTGVCIDTGGWGICAERSAVAAMVTAREFRIAQVVAVWREWRDQLGAVHVVSPCGVCRDFMLQVDPGNVDADVILGPGRVLKLGELVPFSSSYVRWGPL